jgi:hypothetical protein
MIPKATISISGNNKWHDIDQTIAELDYVDITPAGASDFTDGWTLKESTAGNVTVNAGVLSMNGSAAYNANGASRATGITRLNGYIEIEKREAANAPVNNNVLGALQLGGSSGLPTGVSVAGSVSVFNYGSGTGVVRVSAGTINQVSEVAARTAGEWVKYRIYVKKNADGLYKAIIASAQGDSWTEETALYSAESVLVEMANPFYVALQRFTNSSSYRTDWKNYKE